MLKALVIAAVAVAAVCASVYAEEPATAAASQAVESSLIKEVSYDAATQVLTVVFVEKNETYEYKKVPETVYKELMAAESKGSYFVKNIKDKYETVKK